MTFFSQNYAIFCAKLLETAGMVPFAIGSETAGSLTYPASRCGITSLRPTFGAVGRSGVMSLSESLVGSQCSVFNISICSYM